MPYRFTSSETFQDGLIRIGIEQINRARSTLGKDVADKAIHETRKSIKRLRALLRLVRSGIGEEAFAEMNTRLRDVARDLSGARDSSVLLATIERLSAAHPELAPMKAKLRPGLLVRASPTAAGCKPDLLTSARTALGDARQAWKSLRLEDASFAPFATGLTTGLRDLRETAASAAKVGNADEVDDGSREPGDDEPAHEWRKTAQRHWRHMRLMEAAWPPYFQCRAVEAKTISDLLGDAQDLALLITWLHDHPDVALKPAKSRELVGLARQEQATLRAQARVRTDRLTAERPKAHARVCEQLWLAAQNTPPSLQIIAPLGSDEPAHERSPATAPARKQRPATKTSLAGGRKRGQARTPSAK